MSTEQSQGERIAKLESRQERIEADIHEIKKEVKEIYEVVTKGKGTWAVAVGLMGLAATIVAGLVITFIANVFSGKGG